MNISKLIKDQTDLFAAMEKRFAEGLTAKDFQQRIASITEDREKQIVERIKALETQKAADISRYDAAIETEKNALEDLKSRRIDPNLKPRPTPGPKPIKPGRQAASKPKGSKPQSAKPDAVRQGPAKKGAVKLAAGRPAPARKPPSRPKPS